MILSSFLANEIMSYISKRFGGVSFVWVVQRWRQSVEFRDSSPLGQRYEQGKEIEVRYFVHLLPMNLIVFLVYL